VPVDLRRDDTMAFSRYFKHGLRVADPSGAPAIPLYRMAIASFAVCRIGIICREKLRSHPLNRLAMTTSTQPLTLAPPARSAAMGRFLGLFMPLATCIIAVGVGKSTRLNSSHT